MSTSDTIFWVVATIASVTWISTWWLDKNRKATKQAPERSEITSTEWVEELAQSWEAEAKERDLMDKLGRHAGDAQYAKGIRWCIEQLRKHAESSSNDEVSDRAERGSLR